MSKKTVKKRRTITKNNLSQTPAKINNQKLKDEFNKNILLYLTIIAIFIVVLLTYRNFFSNSRKPTSKSCITTPTEVKNLLKKDSEVKRYLNSLKNDIDRPYIYVEPFLPDTKESKTVFAYLGKQSENNSIFLSTKYLFLTGCNSQYQKEPNVNIKKYSPIRFDYNYLVARKTYIDQTKYCLPKLSQLNNLDIDQDGELEYLYGCFTGYNNIVDYSIFKIKEGRVYLLDSFKSYGYYQQIADYNNDHFPDITTVGILLDENKCKGNKCLAPIQNPQSAKQLLKRAYRRIWNPLTNKFNSPQKAEIFYMQDGQKITVK